MKMISASQRMATAEGAANLIEAAGDTARSGLELRSVREDVCRKRAGPERLV
jgi:hypothetical protein